MKKDVPFPAPGLHAESLDCVQANLGVVADCLHGPGAHLVMGSTLRFACPREVGGLPTVEPRALDQVRELAPLLGLAIVRTWSCEDLEQVRATGGGGSTRYALADSWAMPWLPYHRRAHMEHSFLLEGGGPAAVVVDGYHNQTQWGLTTPGVWEVPWPELPLPMTVVELRRAAGDPVRPFPAVDLGPFDEYLDAYARHADRRAALERLSVEIWLLARARHLHAAYRGAVGLPVPVAHLERWHGLATRVFLAVRRVQRGRPEPPGVLDELADALAADHHEFRTHEFGTEEEVVRHG